MNSKKIMLIGWDAADWKVIHPLLDKGKMPNLAGLVENGVMGNIASLRPELSPLLWTSIITGKRPFKHGILGFTEPAPEGMGIQPISSFSRKTKTLWNILHLNNYRSLVVGWWPSHPAEPINGVMVSNHFQRAVAEYGKPWPIVNGSVHPPRLVNILGKLRTHPQDLHSGLMQLFLPDIINMNQKSNRRVEELACIIAETTTVKDISVALLKNEPWDFAAIYFDGLDHFSHGFMNFHPPKLPWIIEKDFNLYNNVIESAYILHDIYLGFLLQHCTEETTVIIISDHGFHSDHLRPSTLPAEPAGPSAQHRPYGIIVISGPDIKKDEIIYGSSLLDICPTILSLFGLPVGQDMDGQPLENCFKKKIKIDHIPSWDNITGSDGSLPDNISFDPVEASDAILQLVELGYIESPSKNQIEAREQSIRELQYNLARCYMDVGLDLKAISILEDLYSKWPDTYRFGIELSYCLQRTGRPELSRSILVNLLKRKKEKAILARKKLDSIEQDLNVPISEYSFDEEKKKQIIKLQQEAALNVYGIYFQLGTVSYSEKKYDQALAYFHKAALSNSSHPALFYHIGLVFEKKRIWLKAEESYSKALQLDPDYMDPLLGLCRINLRNQRNTEAAHFALDALGLQFHNPLAHYLLGFTLFRLGNIAQAVEALEMSILQNPNFTASLRLLSFIHTTKLRDLNRAKYYRSLAREASKRISLINEGTLPPLGKEKGKKGQEKVVSDMMDYTFPPYHKIVNNRKQLDKTIVVVSGLPRSGTSMMMQMLEAGGLPLLYDNDRPPDEDNPKGYYEYSRVKTLTKSSSWLKEAQGKGVKIISHLLPSIMMSHHSFCVIFMERDFDELLSSQNKMLQRNNKKISKTPQSILKSVYIKQIKNIQNSLLYHKIPTHFVQYQDCIISPDAEAKKVNRFLGGNLNVKAMTRVVKLSLYRQRSAKNEN